MPTAAASWSSWRGSVRSRRRNPTPAVGGSPTSSRNTARQEGREVAMPGIMGDHDVEGYFQELIRLCTSPAWRAVWESLNFSVETFASLGLPEDAPDAVVWQTCQARQVVLVTGNRNQEGP